VKNLFATILVLITSNWACAQNEITEAEYFIDQDPGFGNAISIDLSAAETLNELFSASFGSLETGTYFAHVRVKDENDQWSIPLKVPFSVQRSELPDINTAEWYIENDPGFGSGNTIDIIAGSTLEESYSASTSGLSNGRRFVHLRCQNEAGAWSIPLKVPFKVQRADLPPIADGEWYIGNDPGFGAGTPIDLEAGEVVDGLETANTEGLSQGRNFAYLRFQNEDGDWSVPLKRPFVINDKFPLDVVAAEYFIDEDPGIGSGIPIEVDADHFVEESYLAEVSPALEIGDHFLYTRVQNEVGDWSINLVRTFSVGTVSTEDQALLNTTTIYPIPTRDFLTVKNDRFSMLEVRVFDMNGRAVEIAWANRDQLDLSALAPGTYLLRIATESGSITRKIVVE
jgi:hypothetical protein